MCLQTKAGGKVSFTINAAGQVYKQTIEFVCLGGAISTDREPKASRKRGVFGGPGRASSGTRWKSMISRVCAYG